MLQSVKIDNFRALRSVEVPLSPLTVLIGPNDSGKSAFLAALQYLINGIAFQTLDHWRHDTRSPISLTATTAEGSGARHSTDETDSKILEALRPCGIFHLMSQGVSTVSQGWHDETGVAPSIAPSGEGVPTLMDFLLRRDRKRFDAIVHTLRSLVPGLDDLAIATPQPAQRRLDLIVENGFRLDAAQTSAGVRLLMAFTALAYHPSPPNLILIEEPEAGIHPKRLADVMTLLREITQGRHCGHAAQIVVSTHSPYLLDLVDLKTDQVLVFSRQADGSRTAEPADRDRLTLFLDEFMLGEVWSNQGEDGLIARRS